MLVKIICDDNNKYAYLRKCIDDILRIKLVQIIAKKGMQSVVKLPIYDGRQSYACKSSINSLPFIHHFVHIMHTFAHALGY